MPEKRFKDPFRGNIREGWGHFVIIIIVILCAVFISVGLMIVITSPPDTADECGYVALSFTEYEIRRSDLFLTGSDGNVYRIGYFKSYPEAIDPSIICGKTVYEVYYKEKSGIIKNMISERGEVIVTFESERKIYRSENLPVIVVMEIFCALAIPYFIMAIYVGRNPEKFTARVRRMFWRDSAWR